MSSWNISELIECTRYGLLVVFVKDDHQGRQICRRVRRKKERLYTEEMYYMKLPKTYNNDTVFLEEGDLVFISQDKIASVLRSNNGKFATVTNGRLSMNTEFFKG